MFIENKQYQTNLVDVNNIRYLLITNFYNDINYICTLKEIINRNIECLGIEYSNYDYSFTVKIKKTAMRKLHGFKHNPDFYYQYISNIFREFISTYEQNVLQALRTIYEDPYQVINYIYNNPSIMANLCHVTCIADNIIIIKL